MSTIVHKDDGGVIHVSVKSDGNVLYFCEKCDRIWTGRLTPKEATEVAFAELWDEVTAVKHLISGSK